VKNSLMGFAALAAASVVMLGASSAAQAALVDFGVAALGGSIIYMGGGTLDQSTMVDLDNALLAVSDVGAGDQSGLSVFPGGLPTNNTVTLSEPVNFGAGMGMVNTPLIGGNVTKTWFGLVNGSQDMFTETLTTVRNIDRSTLNAITVTLVGTLSDADGLFLNAPAKLILGVTQVSGSGGAVSASLTNTASTSNVPEPSTWVMMALGFAGLGYAAVRRSSKDRSALAL